MIKKRKIIKNNKILIHKQNKLDIILIVSIILFLITLALVFLSSDISNKLFFQNINYKFKGDINNLKVSQATSTIYYVDDISGNDSNSGYSQDQAWKTISHVNSFIFQPGDQILFKRGGVYREQLIIPSSGSEGNNIIFGSYGTGEKPIISAADAISNWTIYQDSIYVADIKNLSSPAQLYVDGFFYNLAHYPNTGFLIVTNSTSNRTIIDTNLTLSSEQIIGSIVMAKALTYRVIPSLAADYNPANYTITLNPELYANLSQYWGYYLQNKFWMLDSPKEWYYNDTAGKVYIWLENNENPNNHTIEISNRSYSINITNKNFITIQDLELDKADINDIFIYNSNGINLTRLDVNDGLYGIVIRNSTNCSLTNNSIQDTLVDGIDAGTFYIKDKVKNIEIKNNYINNAGNIGMPRTSYAGIYIGNWGLDYAESINIKNNIINNSGYMGILFSGNLINVERNMIDRSCLVLDDCGGIYTSAIQGLDSPELDAIYPSKNTINSNIVTNTIGNCKGTINEKYNCYTITSGIYLDAVAYTNSVINNTVINADNGIFSNDGHDNVFSGNKVYYPRGNSLYLVSGSFNASITVGGLARNNTIINNILTCNNTKLCIGLQNNAINNSLNFGIFNYNKFCHTIDNNVVMILHKGLPTDPGYNPDNKLTYTWNNLSMWQKYSNQDLNSIDISSLCPVEYPAPEIFPIICNECDKPDDQTTGTNQVYSQSNTAIKKNITNSTLINNKTEYRNNMSDEILNYSNKDIEKPISDKPNIYLIYFFAFMSLILFIVIIILSFIRYSQIQKERKYFSLERALKEPYEL